jgi:hypothetical protein
MLSLRFGSGSAPAIMPTVMSTLSRVRNFSERLREFLSDVNRSGLQASF